MYKRQALHYTAMNHALQKKVYMDEATGLPNKNKCEELLSAPEMITMPVGVCSFDLNNLRRINNSMGHEKGDAYIRDVYKRQHKNGGGGFGKRGRLEKIELALLHFLYAVVIAIKNPVS